MDGIVNMFNRIGARAAVARVPGFGKSIELNVRRDRFGEYFTVLTDGRTDVRPGPSDPGLRHAVVIGVDHRSGERHRFLCGHDERHWFVAGIPERHGISSVEAAMEALKPAPVRMAQESLGVRAKDRQRRHNAGYVRQGEWFFVPRPARSFDGPMVLRDEPLRRSMRGKPHTMEFAHRTGGESVWVCWRHPQPLTQKGYEAFRAARPESARWGWQLLRRGASVFAKGRVTHADHATVHLGCWHEVFINTEGAAAGQQFVAFLD